VEGEGQAHGPEPAAAQHYLNKLLRSTALANSPRARKFLQFVVTKKLSGEESFLKETVIALEVFEKHTDFDPRFDATVRSGANRLRAKLKEYYQTEGMEDTLRIELPEGHYVARFINRPAVVVDDAPPSAVTAPSPAASSTSPAPLASKHARRPPVLWTSLVILLLLVVTVLLSWHGDLFHEGAAGSVLGKPGQKALTVASGHIADIAAPPKYPDREVSPTFSPDGKQLAYHSSGGTQPNNNIYRKAISGGSAVRLTRGPDDDRNPVWSADGKLIAFVRNMGRHGAIYLITPQGESRGRLTGTTDWSVAWFPTSTYLAIMDRIPGDELYGIVLVELATGKRHTLVPPSIRPTADHILDFAPDGRSLAFVNGSEIFMVPVNTATSPPSVSGPIKPITRGNRELYGFSWMPDGRSILFSADRGGGPTLWLTSTSQTSEPRQLQFEGLYALRPVVSRRCAGQPTRLAYERHSARVNIWRFDFSEARRLIHTPTKVTFSKYLDGAPQWSPDGKGFAFSSSRDGVFRNYLAGSDGSKVVALTPSGVYSASPRWSPDGRRVAFDSVVGGNCDIYVANRDDFAIRRLTTEPSQEARPSWSGDGRWIYFCSDRNRNQSHEIWKIRSDGSGEARQLTRHGGFEAFESLDRKYVYYIRSMKEPGLWRMSIDGRNEVPVSDAVSEGHWSIARDGIFFMSFRSFATSRSIQFLSFAHPASPESVYQTDADATNIVPGLSVTADGRSLLVPLLENQASEIEVVNNFESKVVGSNFR
jgi:Tol biopolymer transport system component